MHIPEIETTTTTKRHKRFTEILIRRHTQAKYRSQGVTGPLAYASVLEKTSFVVMRWLNGQYAVRFTPDRGICTHELNLKRFDWLYIVEKTVSQGNCLGHL